VHSLGENPELIYDGGEGRPIQRIKNAYLDAALHQSLDEVRVHTKKEPIDEEFHIGPLPSGLPKRSAMSVPNRVVPQIERAAQQFVPRTFCEFYASASPVRSSLENSDVRATPAESHGRRQKNGHE